MQKRAGATRVAIALLVALICVLGLSVFSSYAHADDNTDANAIVAAGEPELDATDAEPAAETLDADAVTPDDALAPDEEPATDEQPEATPETTSPEGDDQTAEEETEEADVPAGPMLAAPQANGDSDGLSCYVYYYKVAGYYSTAVSPSIYDGGRRQTLDATRPVGFEEGMQFSALYDSNNGYIKVGHNVTTDNNPYRWTCVGFVPVKGDPGYGSWVRDVYLKTYCFGTVEEGEQFVKDNGGVLYGEVPSPELIETLSSYPASRGLIVVWSRALPSLPDQKYEYGDPIIDDAKPVDWQPTTSGVKTSAEVRTESIDGHVVTTIVYTVVIPEGTDDDVLNINLAEVPVPDSPALQPGDDVHYRIDVKDESGHRYTYLEGSGSLGTTLSDSADPVSIGFERYDISSPNLSHGQSFPICLPGGWRIYNIALDELYGATQLSHKDTPNRDNELNQLGDIRIGYALALAGYEYHPDDDLVMAVTGKDDPGAAWDFLRGFLSYLAKRDITLDDATYYRMMTAEDYENTVKVLKDLTQNRLDDYFLDWMNDRYKKIEGAEGDGPWFTSFKDAPANLLWDIMNGISAGSMPESNRSVANAVYYGFYEYFYPVKSSKDGATQGVYTIMKESVEADPADLPEGYDASLATGNGYDDDLLEQWNEAGDDATEHVLGWWHNIAGKANGNVMQDTAFFVCAQFKLVKPVVEVKVLKVWDDQDNKDGSRPASVTVKLQANGEDASQDALTLDESSEWSGSWQRMNRYADNKEIAYTVEETPVPTGYKNEATSETDDNGNVTITVKNSHTPEEPPAPDNPPKPSEPDKPKPVIPVTGEQGLAAAGALALLSLAVLTAANVLRRASDGEAQEE